MKPIRLYWFRDEQNFGDALSPILLERLSGRAVVHSDVTACDVIAIGSLLDIALRHRWRRLKCLNFHRTLIWGTGSFGRTIDKRWNRLDVKAVRGPRTRDALGLEASLPLGDPGLLIDRLVEKRAKNTRWGIIPHMHHRKSPVIQQISSENRNSTVIDVGALDVLSMLSEISRCEFVISSSLHGIIAADALGIPNVWMTLEEELVGGRWKFDDYFSSVNRAISEPVSPSGSLKELEGRATCASAAVVAARQHDLDRSFSSMNL